MAPNQPLYHHHYRIAPSPPSLSFESSRTASLAHLTSPSPPLVAPPLILPRDITLERVTINTFLQSKICALSEYVA
ncbi:hypothetical protein L873DRAFT_1807941 [Choiromyces venosus 120613-1]|uniref:Uncharacterized protein n=1 Tax=Choiromyces venosus 120613-1 TaxID=1336337 RepID=A0A3N4JY34_9PEZI|nr:hypothetical protein L873DRAFT_1807941 [Choiromyces venosus 120613-1]